MTAKKQKTRKEPVPMALPRMEDVTAAPEVIPEVESAAIQYAEVRDRRMELTEVEVSRKGQLLLLMKSNGIDKYDNNDHGIHVHVVATQNVKVKVAKEV